MKLVECVPNFSEGRNKSVIEAIADSIRSVNEVSLLDIDPGYSTNRTVMTFTGSPQAVLEAAYQAIARARDLIDMRKHSGEHPRIGATDVCPFVPVAGVSMEECVELANQLAQMVSEKLGIPVYLYEAAAKDPARKNLANIRQGEYEALEERMRNGFLPDYGPGTFNPQSGATVIGARPFLIAYNINLNSKSKKLANEIALNIREQGRAKRDRNGQLVKDAQGITIKVPGTLPACRAVGWYVDEYQRAQISINLVDYKKTCLHHAFDECEKQAKELGLRVTGSELVGLVPLEPLLAAGKHYLLQQNRCSGVPEKELLHTAIMSLGLSEISPFKPEEKIIDFRVQPPGRQLVNLSVSDFVDELSSESAAPGGGSVGALAGALSAALSSMVANLTHERKGYEHIRSSMDNLACRAQELKQQFLKAVDADTEAFNRILATRKLPKDTEENQKLRLAAMETATQEATLVPFQVLNNCEKALELAEIVLSEGISGALSDAGVAISMARSAADATLYNVLINLQDCTDNQFVQKVLPEANRVFEKIKAKSDDLQQSIRQRLLDSLQVAGLQG